MPPPIAELGDESDPAWGGSGNGTLISVLKGIWEKLAGILTVRNGVKDSTGVWIYPDSLPMTGATYDVDGNPLTMTKSDGTDSWVMTFTWDANGNLLTQSVWERQ